MSDWYWRVVALKAAFIITCFATYIRADESVQKLPFCNPHSADNAAGQDDLVLVSTLDGKLTAFSTTNGNKAWDVQTQPLLSSNLHHVELTSGGKWVRLVPSLRGTLYSLSGDTVEPLPFSAEQLLSSSFKYSNDLVIAGSKETLWLGVDAATGTVVYECGGAGCGGERGGAGPLLAVRRHASTVRALDPATGDEKWNFSVAEHHVAVTAPRDCVPPTPPSGPGGARLEYSVRVAPEGGVAVCSHGTRAVLWQQRLEAPVANMWRLRGGSLEHIDVLWAATKSLSAEPYAQDTPPSLYIGLHNQQLYIQEGELYVQKMETAVSSKPLPWRLKNSRPLISGPDQSTALQNADPNTLSLITLYGDIRQGNHGFFLYQEETCDQSVQVSDNDLNQPEIIQPQDHQDPGSVEHHHVHVHVYSLWFWWKEVLLIVISSTLLMNLMIWPRFFAPKFRPASPLPINKEYIVVEKHYPTPAISRSGSGSGSGEYSGRYETDFTPLRCLGRGGFGVVFEARNNIDHCSYAVKRITLPRRQSQRERVLREVRALAKLEHEHIVRYFNAWLEEPPAAWQQARDTHWLRELDGVSVAMTEECTSSHAQRPPTRSGLEEAATHSDGALDLPSKRLRSRSCNDSFSIVFDENAKDSTTKSISSLKNSLDFTNIPLPPNLSLAKNLATSNDDSYIVFANTGDLNHNSKGGSEIEMSNRQLERVQECEEYSKEAGPSRKKKGHTRHWSLDMCVKSDDPPPSENKMYLYIQMQLCRRDSLHDWLRQNRSYESRQDQARTLFSQIVSAVEYVHLAGLIHRDLKPSNIFFAPDGKVKVGDFGLVTAMGDTSDAGAPHDPHRPHARHTYRVGTHLYMSPEQISGRAYSYKVDVWSLGLVLFELLQPFGTEAERVRSLLALRRGEYPSHTATKYPEEMEVVKLMLSADPCLRPTAAGVRARAPLYQDTDTRYHFTLPPPATAHN